ncbi:hypothetical protein [Dactylosporangium sp. CA-139066]|uniref:hypothetical protein n=1 Tax=Dactylosporangium sp. CA-139066 TaxID=3239930 RepID=UPI003D927335
MTNRAGRAVRVEAPGGRVETFAVNGDDTLTVLVDGTPLLGVDEHGAGHSPDGGAEWHRRPGQVTERYAMVLGMAEDQFHDLLAHLGLPPSWWGRWKGAPGETRDIMLSSETGSCGNHATLDRALAWARERALAYEETTTVRYPARP